MILVILSLLAHPELALEPQETAQLQAPSHQAVTLYADHPLHIHRHENNTVAVQLQNNTRPGVYNTYLYSAKKTNQTIVALQTHPVTVHVPEEQTKKTSYSWAWLLLVAAIIAGLTQRRNRF